MRPSVRHTIDFDRIMALPRRVPRQVEADAWSVVLTPELRLPWSDAVIRPWQAYAAVEIADAPFGRGAFLCLSVGAGKTWIMFTAPLMRDDVERILYVVPASLEDKTEADFAELRKDWRDHKKLYKVVTREWLAREAAADFLDQFAPDMIIIDESDELSNADRSAPLKLGRYIWANKHVRVIALTATPSRNSIMGYWHILLWCLREGAPVPMSEHDALELAAALDEMTGRGGRLSPGPWGDSRKEACENYRRRLIETPGVLIVDGDSCEAPLTIRTRLAKECGILNGHYQEFLEHQRNPDDIQVTDPLSRWQMDGQLGCGLYRRYINPPPEDWKEARRESAKFVREAIAHSQRSKKPLYTEAMVYRRFEGHPIVQRWRELKPTFSAETEAVWLSTSTLESAIEWIEESPEPGIIWCGSVDFAKALAKATGLRYYARNGRAKDGSRLYSAPVENIIVSWNANKKGFNLQPWTRQLIVMPPQSAKWIEQIIGRSHRSGQESHVYVDILLTSGGTIDLVEAMLREARFAKRTISLTQKALRAKVHRTTPNITPENEFRWATRNKDEK
jgi:hypothetical protein